MDKELRTGLIIFGIIGILITSVIIGFTLSSRDKDGTEDEPIEIVDDEPPEPVFNEVNITVDQAFYMDRLATFKYPYEPGQKWLVMWIEFQNPLEENITLHTDKIRLITDYYTYTPTISSMVGQQLNYSCNLTPQENISKYVIFSVVPDEKMIKIEYNDTDVHLAISENLSGIEIGYKEWVTPLEFQITGCGRDELGSGMERYLHFFLEVKNPTINGTEFESWKIDLLCHNDVHLDGLFVERPDELHFRPGWNITYKIYFDIPRGSPDYPKVLFYQPEGMFLDVNSTLYNGLI